MRRALHRSSASYAVILPPTTEDTVQGAGHQSGPSLHWSERGRKRRGSHAPRLSIGQRTAERGGAGRRALGGVRPDGRVTAVGRPEERSRRSCRRGGRRQCPGGRDFAARSQARVSSSWGGGPCPPFRSPGESWGTRDPPSWGGGECVVGSRGSETHAQVDRALIPAQSLLAPAPFPG